MRVLVCGGRCFDDPKLLGSWLGGINKQHGISLLIDGGAPGADRMAREFARWAAIPTKTFAAEWGKFGRSAGPRRNAKMLAEGTPDLVVAFHGGTGTADMIRQARQAGIRVIDTDSPESIAIYNAALAANAAVGDH